MRIVGAALYLHCIYAFAAGIQLLCGSAAIAGAAALLLSLFLFNKGRLITLRWIIDVQISYAGEHVRFQALIDTGNRLQERKTGLPVLIVEEALLSEIMESLRRRQAEVQQLPYGGVGGSGSMQSFHPDNVQILLPGALEIPAPDCWAAVYPGKLPGGIQALAPPEFAETLQHVQDRSRLRNRIRRLCIYGIFKRKAVHLRSGGSNSQGIGLLHRRK